MKRMVMAAAAATLAFAGAVQAQEKTQMAFVVNGASDFWKAAEAGVKKAQGELTGYALSSISGQDPRRLQNG